MKNLRLLGQGQSKMLPGESGTRPDKLGLEGGKGLSSESRKTIHKWTRRGRMMDRRDNSDCRNMLSEGESAGKSTVWSDCRDL